MTKRMTTARITDLISTHATAVQDAVIARIDGTLREMGVANAEEEAQEALLAAIEQLRSEAIDLATAATTARIKTAIDRAAA